jgi:hypothetical protein
MIYFIKCHGYVKIGRGAMPEERLRALQTGNPYKIHLMGAFDGSDAEEHRIHDAFKQFHHHGEWYYLSDTIRSFVDKHCKRGFAGRSTKRPPVVSKKPQERGETPKRQISNFTAERENKFRRIKLVVDGDDGYIHQNSEDVVGAIKLFFSERTTKDTTSRIQSSILYDAFLSWCEKERKPPCTITAFGRKTRKLGIKKSQPDEDPRRIVYYEGIRLIGDVGILRSAA